MNWKKMGCIVVVIIIALIAGSVFINNFKNKTAALPDASYMITTISRTYFSDDVTQEDDVYTLHGYWELIKNKWKLQKNDLRLDPQIFGKVQVKAATKRGN